MKKLQILFILAFILCANIMNAQLNVSLSQPATTNNYQMRFTGTNFSSIPSNLQFPMVEFRRNTHANFKLRNTIINGGGLEIGVASSAGDFSPTSEPGDVIFRALHAENSLTFAIPVSVNAINRPIRFVHNTNGNIMTVMSTGKVGIGVEDSKLDDLPWATGDQNYLLYVRRGIRTERIKVDADINWPDYVFANDYELKPLSSVEKFINENSHLPNVPSAQEISNNGIDIAQMDATLLQKIEELTLYTIQQQKQIEMLNQQLNALQEKLNNNESK